MSQGPLKYNISKTPLKPSLKHLHFCFLLWGIQPTGKGWKPQIPASLPLPSMSVLPKRSCLCPLNFSHTHQLLASSQSLCFNSRESATSWSSATGPRTFSLFPLPFHSMFNTVPEGNDQITWFKFASGLMVINDGAITKVSNIYWEYIQPLYNTLLSAWDFIKNGRRCFESLTLWRTHYHLVNVLLRPQKAELLVHGIGGKAGLEPWSSTSLYSRMK